MKKSPRKATVSIVQYFWPKLMMKIYPELQRHLKVLSEEQGKHKKSFSVIIFRMNLWPLVKLKSKIPNPEDIEKLSKCARKNIVIFFKPNNISEAVLIKKSVTVSIILLRLVKIFAQFLLLI